MLFDITTGILNKFFPENFNFTKIVLSTAGTDTVVDFNIDFEDSNNKIVNNEITKKSIKLKIFQITSDEMQEKILSFKNISDLNYLLSTYEADYLDINAGYDYKPTEDSEIFTYNKKLILRETNYSYLKIGAFFYFDIQDFIEENNISQQYLYNQKLWGNIKIIDVNNSDVVNDLTNLKIPFENNKKLIDIISTIQIDKKFTNFLSSKTQTIPKNSLFSNIFITRHYENSVGFLFSINYDQIIKDITFYDDYFSNSNIENYISYFDISSIKIFRREIKKIKNKKTILPNTNTLIVESHDEVDTGVKAVDNDKAYIKETAIDFGLPNILERTFEVKDKKIYNTKDNYYEYGVSITLRDKFNSYIKEKIKNLENDIRNLNYYLSETNKIVSLKTGKGFYDTFSGRFTKQFVINGFPLHSQNVSAAIDNISDLLFFFNITKQEEIEDFKTYLTNLLNPKLTNAETISLVIDLFNKCNHQINNIIKNNKNNYFTIENWFTNDFVDTSISPNIGYQYLTLDNINGIGSVAKQQLINRDFNEKKLISTNTIVSRFASFSPILVKVEQESLNLLDNLNTLKPSDYANMEMAIKRYNLLDKSERNVTFANKQTDTINEKFNKIVLKNQRPFAKLNIFAKNTFKAINSDILKNKKKEIFNTSKPDEEVDPTYLFLSLLKPINSKKTGFFEKKIEILKSFKEIRENKENLPHQILSFYENKNNIIKLNENPLQDLNSNSKFLLNLNTLAEIEILSYNEDLKKEIWKKLDYNELNNLNSIHFCRLKIYQNSNLSINGFEEIKLPIYNQYFVISADLTTEIQKINRIKKPINPIRLNKYSTFPLNTKLLNIVNDTLTYSTEVCSAVRYGLSNNFTDEQAYTNSGLGDPPYYISYENFRKIWVDTNGRPDVFTWIDCEKRNQNTYVLAKLKQLGSNITSLVSLAPEQETYVRNNVPEYNFKKFLFLKYNITEII